MMKLAMLPTAVLLLASPAVAAPPSVAEAGEIQRVLNDPRMAEQLGSMAQALSKALLDMPVGEIQAAAEGRKATPREKNRTVRDLGRAEDPNFERNLQRQVAQAGPVMQASMKAMSAALPAMLKGMSEAAEALERGMANMPSPTYPKR